MENWTIARQIGFLSKILMAGLVVLALVGIGANLRLGMLFADFTRSASTTDTAFKISEELLRAESAELRYRRSNDPADAVLVHEILENVTRLEEEFQDLPSSGAAITQDKRRLADDTGLFGALFDESERFQEDRNRHVAAIVTSGPLVLEELNELIAAMQFDNDPVGIAQLYDARQASLRAQLDLERFLLTNRPEAFEASRAQMSLARDRLSAFAADVQRKERAGAADSVLATIAEFWTAAEGAFNAITERNARRIRMGEISDQLLADTAAIVDQGHTRMADLTRATDQTRVLSLVVVVLVSVGAVGVSLVLAARITRSVTTGINRSVTELRAVAEGHLETEISRTEAETELGEIARTLIVFRDNAIANEKLRQDQRNSEKPARNRSASGWRTRNWPRRIARPGSRPNVRARSASWALRWGRSFNPPHEAISRTGWTTSSPSRSFGRSRPR